MSYCPECDALIEEEVEDIGDIITCPECGVDLEVISLDPVEFDLAPAEDEDEEDEDYDFDDEEEEGDWEDEEDDDYDDEREEEYN